MRPIPALAAMSALALVAGCTGQAREVAPSANAPAPLARLRPAAIELPADEASFGADPAGEVLDGACLACHSASMVLYQPPLDRKQWTGVVTKMREAYHAPIDEADTAAIVDALMAKAPARP